MSEPFVPFDATAEEIEYLSVLRDGLSATLSASVLGWIRWATADKLGMLPAETVNAITNALDLPLVEVGLTATVVSSEKFMQAVNRLPDQQVLRIVDYLLHRMGANDAGGQRIEAMLAEGRSRYTATKRGTSYRLAERVPAAVQDSAERLMATAGPAGALLGQAFNKVYDYEPDDSAAYAYAVKAVETAALKALNISHDTATLSDAIRAIESGKTTWGLPFKREHTEYKSRDVLVGMMKSLYRGQRDRHGSEAYEGVTHDEAEAAVLMAVSLVGWFGGSLVAQRDKETFA